MGWVNLVELTPFDYVCGYCNCYVGSIRGWYRAADTGAAQESRATVRVYVCSKCDKPTFFEPAKQIPGVGFGDHVDHVPDNVAHLYDEARRSIAANAHTGAVLLCRKLLMNIAVQKGASPGKSFAHYVEYLASKGYVPPDGQGWVDHIRQKGNEATHEIVEMSGDDAKELVTFAEMLLRFVFEFPSRVPKKP